jgi:hypothetical protein
MSTEREFAQKIRHHLNLGAEAVDRRIADRLFAARRNALAHHKARAGMRLSLADFGHLAHDIVLPHARAVAGTIGLVIAVIGISVWNDFQKAAEFEEIDSALLADDLPIDAYLDKGFQAWLSQLASQD